MGVRLTDWHGAGPRIQYRTAGGRPAARELIATSSAALILLLTALSSSIADPGCGALLCR